MLRSTRFLSINSAYPHRLQRVLWMRKCSCSPSASLAPHPYTTPLHHTPTSHAYSSFISAIKHPPVLWYHPLVL